jgi:hypothetical protein
VSGEGESKMNEAQKIYCCDCGEELQGAMYHIGNEDYICEDCRDYYSYCEHCEALVPDEDIVSVDNNRRFVCNSCADYYYTCSHCGNLFSSYYIAADTYHITLCTDCYDEHYFTCEDCREVYHVDEAEYIGGCVYCISCAEGHEVCILSYSAKPDPVFFGDNEAGYYGLEVEIDNGLHKQDAARAIIEAGRDHIYLKEDGSLSRDGMEIVTHPATLDYHIKHFPWSDICRTALSYRYRSHDTDTCGLHIHASRSLFGDNDMEQDLTIAKIILLVDRWYDTHIVRFARRDFEKMCRWADKPNACIRPEDNDIAAIEKSKKSANTRYKALNLTNSDTVEFRFFRGTLKQDTIIASIQWVDTIIQYCRSTPLKDLFSITWNDIFGNTGHAELTDYLKQRNLYNVKEGN